MRTLTRAETGALIERLGRSVAAGDTPWETAVAELMAAPTADTRLSRQGAIGQLTAWQTAVARYSFTDNATPAQPPVDVRTLTARTPITFRFPPRQDAHA